MGYNGKVQRRIPLIIALILGICRAQNIISCSGLKRKMSFFCSVSGLEVLGTRSMEILENHMQKTMGHQLLKGS